MNQERIINDASVVSSTPLRRWSRRVLPRMVNCIGGIPVHQIQGGGQGTADFGRNTPIADCLLAIGGRLPVELQDLCERLEVKYFDGLDDE